MLAQKKIPDGKKEEMSQVCHLCSQVFSGLSGFIFVYDTDTDWIKRGES